jgi:hypothetical protein
MKTLSRLARMGTGCSARRVHVFTSAKGDVRFNLDPDPALPGLLAYSRETAMKSEMRMMAFRFGCVLGITMMAGGVMANGGDNDNSDLTIEGTWLSRVTTPNPPPGVPPSFLSMATFTGAGQALEANNTTQDRTVAQGEWTRIGHRQFVRTITFFVFGTGHVFTSFTQITSRIELARNGETYTASNEFHIYDANGVLLVSGQNTSVANRCGLGDSIPSCIPS